jgi:molybdopterin-biosynthesis enzyme MoeA-like protein
MPIEAPTANVMATIWNGGIGPADTDRAARAAHRAMAAKPAAMARRRSAAAIMGGA